MGDEEVGEPQLLLQAFRADSRSGPGWTRPAPRWARRLPRSPGWWPGPWRCRCAEAGPRRTRGDSGRRPGGSSPTSSRSSSTRLARALGVTDPVDVQRLPDGPAHLNPRVRERREDPGRSSACDAGSGAAPRRSWTSGRSPGRSPPLRWAFQGGAWPGRWWISRIRSPPPDPGSPLRNLEGDPVHGPDGAHLSLEEAPSGWGSAPPAL